MMGATILTRSTRQDMRDLEHIEIVFRDKKTGEIYDDLEVDISTIPCERIQTVVDKSKIPSAAGVYWIVTDEPIRHCFNKGDRCTKMMEDGLRVVYNGVTTDLRSRMADHLLSRRGFSTRSGISVDILTTDNGKSRSHVKHLFAPKYLTRDGLYRQSRDKPEILEMMNLSELEKETINIAAAQEDVWFQNGIHVGDPKHAGYRWMFAYYPHPNHNLRDIIETSWRKKHGIPPLCTYTEGR